MTRDPSPRVRVTSCGMLEPLDPIEPHRTYRASGALLADVIAKHNATHRLAQAVNSMRVNGNRVTIANPCGGSTTFLDAGTLAAYLHRLAEPAPDNPENAA